MRNYKGRDVERQGIKIIQNWNYFWWMWNIPNIRFSLAKVTSENRGSYMICIEFLYLKCQDLRKVILLLRMKYFACCDWRISSYYCSFFPSVAATEPHVSLSETVQHIALPDVHLPAPQHWVLNFYSFWVGFTYENPGLHVKLLHLMHISVKGVTRASSIYLLV